MSSGKVVQVIGAVVDVEFPRDSVPKVYDALMVAERGLTLEVQQQLGDGVVRTIAMGSSEGVSRGLAVDNTGIIFVGRTALSVLIKTNFFTPAAIAASDSTKVPNRLFLIPSNKLSSTSGTCLYAAA